MSLYDCYYTTFNMCGQARKGMLEKILEKIFLISLLASRNIQLGYRLLYGRNKRLTCNFAWFFRIVLENSTFVPFPLTIFLVFLCRGGERNGKETPHNVQKENGRYELGAGCADRRGGERVRSVLTEKEAATAESYRSPMRVTHLRVFPDSAFYLCPRCNIPMEREFQAYCDRCGQHLDWKEYRQAIIV